MFKYIKPNDIVLEIGGRYGVVSNTIQLLLKNKKNHVVVNYSASLHNFTRHSTSFHD